jgi:hypothetical protein
MEVDLRKRVVHRKKLRHIFKYHVKGGVLVGDETPYRQKCEIKWIPLKKRVGRPRKLKTYRPVGRSFSKKIVEKKFNVSAGRPRKNPTKAQRKLMKELAKIEKQKEHAIIKVQKSEERKNFRRTGRR